MLINSAGFWLHFREILALDKEFQGKIKEKTSTNQDDP